MVSVARKSVMMVGVNILAVIFLHKGQDKGLSLSYFQVIRFFSSRLRVDVERI